MGETAGPAAGPEFFGRKSFAGDGRIRGVRMLAISAFRTRWPVADLVKNTGPPCSTEELRTHGRENLFVHGEPKIACLDLTLHRRCDFRTHGRLRMSKD